jgi:hypothetical protein
MMMRCISREEGI